MAAEETVQQGNEGTVNWDAAKEFMEGKATAGDAEGDTTPEAGDFIEVSIKGKKVKMTKEAADAYAGFVRETRERDSRLGGEISQLKERSARLEGTLDTLRVQTPKATDEIKPPPAELARTDWEEYHRQSHAYHAAMMLRQQAELEAKYTADLEARDTRGQEGARQQAWADRFYSSNPNLNKPHLRAVVHTVYAENAKEINSFGEDVDGAHARLAELAEERILAIKAEGKQTSAGNKPPRLEGSGGPASTKATDKPKPATSAADWVAKKRAQLRGGR